jgi:hypothetical protein
MPCANALALNENNITAAISTAFLICPLHPVIFPPNFLANCKMYRHMDGT